MACPRQPGRLASRQLLSHAHAASGISGYWAWQVLDQPRSSQRYLSQRPVTEESVAKRVVDRAVQFGRYGYRRIAGPAPIGGGQFPSARLSPGWGQADRLARLAAESATRVQRAQAAIRGTRVDSPFWINRLVCRPAQGLSNVSRQHRVLPYSVGENSRLFAQPDVFLRCTQRGTGR